MTGIKWSEDYEVGRPVATPTADVPTQRAVVARARIIHLSHPRTRQLADADRELLLYTMNGSSQAESGDVRLWALIPGHAGAEPAQCEGGKR
jgi:hypothetical protein